MNGFSPLGTLTPDFRCASLDTPAWH